MSANQSPNLTIRSPLPWLEITPSNDGKFQSKVASALHNDQDKIRTLAPVLPYSVVLTNTGSVDLAGVCVRYTLTIRGREVHLTYFYNSFGDLARPVIPRGESRLFTPLKTANALAAGASSAGIRDRNGNESPTLTSDSEKQVLRDLANSPAVDVSVDLMVANDGRTAGPDASKTVLRITQQDEAFRAMHQELLQRLSEGASDQDLIQWLTPLSEAPNRRDPQTRMPDPVVASRTNIATAWLAEIRAGRRQQLHQRMAISVPVPVMTFRVGELR